MDPFSFKFLILRTQGFCALGEEVQGRILKYAIKSIKPKTDMIFFYPEGEVPNLCPECKKPHLEDEGRSLVVPNFPGLDKKVYAKLDDYGDPSEWDEMYEEEIAEELRKAPGCRYTVTFLLAEEY